MLRLIWSFFLTLQVTVRASCDLSCSEAASEGEEFSRLFDIAGCDFSATDDDDDYEPRPSRKRGGAPGGTVAGKKVKQEETSAEDFDSAANMAVTDAASLACRATPDTHCEIAHTLLPNRPLPPSSQHMHGQAIGDEGSVDPETELLGGRSCTTGPTEHSKRCSSATETTGKTAGTALLWGIFIFTSAGIKLDFTKYSKIIKFMHMCVFVYSCLSPCLLSVKVFLHIHSGAQ